MYAAASADDSELNECAVVAIHTIPFCHLLNVVARGRVVRNLQ
jgi:hypothetical protein